MSLSNLTSSMAAILLVASIMVVLKRIPKAFALRTEGDVLLKTLNAYEGLRHAM